MRLIIKYPTRGRPKQFLETLKGWVDGMSDPDGATFVVSYDSDDASMTDSVISQASAMLKYGLFFKGESPNKIHACNRDVDKFNAWDVLLLISDDMVCRRHGWDQIIRNNMMEFYSDMDGCLWFHDDSKQRVISTLSCMGRKYYDRFGFAYNPEYSSFFCDNEYTDIARSLNKITFIEKPICSHDHPAWKVGIKSDDLYRRNNKYWHQDQATYERRKAAGFPA